MRVFLCHHLNEETLIELYVHEKNLDVPRTDQKLRKKISLDSPARKVNCEIFFVFNWFFMINCINFHQELYTLYTNWKLWSKFFSSVCSWNVKICLLTSLFYSNWSYYLCIYHSKDLNAGVSLKSFIFSNMERICLIEPQGKFNCPDKKWLIYNLCWKIIVLNHFVCLC